MKENMQRLSSLLSAIKCFPPLDEDGEYRLTAMDNGIVAMILKEGAEYQKKGDEFFISVDDDEYSVPESYVGAYLGDIALSEIKQRDGAGVEVHYETQTLLTESDLEDIDSCVGELEYHVSRLYQDIVLGSSDSIPALKARIAELTEMNDSLKKELRREKAKNAALNDRLNIISGKIGGRNSGTHHATDIVTQDKEQSHPENVAKDISGTLVSSTQSHNGTEIVEWDYDETPKEPETTSLTPTEEISEEIDEPAGAYGIFPYQDDIYEMSKHAFCFVYNKLLLVDAEDEDDEIDFVELLAIPLSTKVKYPDMLIWTAQNEETHTQVVKGAPKTKLDFGTFQITLSGVMKGNEFKTYIKHTTEDSPYRLEIDSQSNGNMGHLYLADESDDSIHVHVCPVTFSNNDEGYADFVYCVECAGEYIQQGDNSEGEVVFTDSYGREKQVLAKWTDNSLYGMIGLSEILG